VLGPLILMLFFAAAEVYDKDYERVHESDDREDAKVD
jgi:hypothetical protein